jgi:hypothetical protein
VLVLEDGEEAFSAITRFAGEQKLTGASLTDIGAFRSATLGFRRAPRLKLENHRISRWAPEKLDPSKAKNAPNTARIAQRNLSNLHVFVASDNFIELDRLYFFDTCKENRQNE